MVASSFGPHCVSLGSALQGLGHKNILNRMLSFDHVTGASYNVIPVMIPASLIPTVFVPASALASDHRCPDSYMNNHVANEKVKHSPASTRY